MPPVAPTEHENYQSDRIASTNSGASSEDNPTEESFRRLWACPKKRMDNPLAYCHALVQSSAYASGLIWLRNKIQSGFLDVTAGLRDAETVPSINAALSPTSTVHKLPKERNNSSEGSHIIHAQDILSPRGVKSIFDFYDRATFTDYPGSNGRRKIRVVARHKDCFFLVSKPPQVISVLPIDPFEESLLLMVNQLFGGMLNVVQEKTGFKPYGSFDNNMIQILVGYISDAAYSMHNDCEVNLSHRSQSFDDERLVHIRNNLIPHESLQTTFTLSVCNSGVKHNTTIQWKAGNAAPLKVLLGDNDITFQPHLVQCLSEHGVSANPELSASQAVRVVLSFRCCITPSTMITSRLMDKVLESVGISGIRGARASCNTVYTYKKVVSSLMKNTSPELVEEQTFLTGTVPIPVDSMPTSLDWTATKRSLPGDSWIVAKKNPADVDPQVPMNTIGLKVDGWKHLVSAAILPSLVEKGIVPMVDVSTAEKKCQPVKHGFLKFNGRYLVPGDEVDVATAYQLLDIPMCNRYRRCWHRNPDQARGVVIAMWYKNEKSSFVEFMRHLRLVNFDWSKLKHDDHIVRIMGSGGNGFAEGQFAAHDLTKEDMAGLNAYLPHSQTLTGQNVALPSLMERNACLHFFCPPLEDPQVDGNLNLVESEVTKSTKVVYYGWHSVDSLLCSKKTSKQVRDIAEKEYGGKNMPNLRFQEAFHYTLGCKPLPVRFPDPDKVFEEKLISSASKFPFQLNVPLTISAALGTSREGQVTEEDINRHFCNNLIPIMNCETFGDHEPPPGVSMTVPEAARGILSLAVAMSFRFLRRNVNIRNEIGYLKGDLIDQLGPVLCLVPTPSHSRENDVSTMHFALCTNSVVGVRDKRTLDWCMSEPNQGFCKDVLFASVLLRVTGRVVPLMELSEFLAGSQSVLQTSSPYKFSLPKLSQVHTALEFIKSTLDQKTRKLTAWRSTQFQVPKSLQYWVNFRSFVRAIAAKISHHNLFEKVVLGSNRGEAYEVLNEALGSMMPKEDRRHMEFVAVQVLHDMELAFCNIFGDSLYCSMTDQYIDLRSSGITFGFGGGHGLKMVNPKNVAYKSERGGVPFTAAKFGAISKELFSTVYGWDRDHLDIVHLYKENGVVKHKLSGRLFSVIDCEHWLCKIYVMIIKTHPSRFFSQPTPWARGMHPVNTDEEYPTHISEIFKESLIAFEKLVNEKRWMDMPGCFLFKDNGGGR